ncbi:unnamed protein product [Linum trigynum]|uniref:Uncharacterized protein n=1 Tax=Linum trigynum TaxID=586398 RepID=A0AAV2FP48_9ROSI
MVQHVQAWLREKKPLTLDSEEGEDEERVDDQDEERADDQGEGGGSAAAADNEIEVVNADNAWSSDD